MGTRADFYVGKHEDAEWIGSIAWDGYRAGIDGAVLQATSEAEFRAAVEAFFAGRDDVTRPDQGWPWPWDTSKISDCSYWFFDGQVYDEVGGAYVPVSTPIEDDDQYEAAKTEGEPIRFPDMSARKNVTLGQRSGIIIIGAK